MMRQPAPSSIPRIIHQIWLEGEVPIRYQPLRRSWALAHPAWENLLWDDRSIRDLLARRAPWFLETYERYPHLHQRADAGRYFILAEHGGFYADIDTEPLRPLDELLAEYPRARLLLSAQPFGGLENRLIRLWVGTRHIITNAVIGSAAGLEAWEPVVRALPGAAARFELIREMNVTYSTGPAFLSMALAPSLSRDRSLVVLPCTYFEPHFGFDPASEIDPRGAAAARLWPERYVIHRQDATWHGPVLKLVFRAYFRLKRLRRAGNP